MMAVESRTLRLIDRLPAARGRYSENAPLSRMTWFRVGGPAEVMFRPADADDLAQFLAEKPDDVPLTVIGVGSNLLVRDGGIPGVVVRMGRGFAGIEATGVEVRAGAGALDINVAALAMGEAITGLEFLRGIPGTVGGALRMNAGAYGSEIKDVILSARVLDAEGVVHDIGVDGLGFGYRRCAIPEDWIFVSALFRGRPGDGAEIARRMEDIQEKRQSTQPVRTSTGGSTFANPPGREAWRLIEEAGCRGLSRGGAVVSDKHCNFLVNIGGATAADLEGLGDEIRRRVLESSGVTLEWEIRRIGVPGPGPAPKEDGS